MILVDTHVLIWALRGDPALGPRQRSILGEFDGTTIVSLASLWEIEIKRSLGKLDAPADLSAGVLQFNWSILPISTEHTRKVGQLPLLHRDPFDRMIVAQAMVEGMALMTADRRLAAYGATVLW